MALNLNTNPYFDDYDEGKNFHRILFKPGFAVQARELTQLQTILQNQITRFGNHVFKDGSLVIPGNFHTHYNYKFVKLELSYNSALVNVDNFLDKEVVGQTSGVRAKVVKVYPAENDDPPTLYVKYLNSGTSFTANSFSTEDILTDDGGTTYGAKVKPQIDTPTGKAIAVSIDTGVFYIKGHFVRVEANTVVLAKYNSIPNVKVGLAVTESIITKNDDASLLDPAIDTYNYFAPGADRYKIGLNLETRELNNTISSDTFIELLRFSEGEIVSTKSYSPEYNILSTELASRTFDESGDYVVDPFTINFIEHLKDPNTSPDGAVTLANGGNSQLALAVINPGKAYVGGYRIDEPSKKMVTFRKPRDTITIGNGIVRTPIGNYVTVSNIHSIPNFTSNLSPVTLYDTYKLTPTSPSGNIVGNARILGFEYDTGNLTLNSGQARAFLFDIKMESGKTFERDVKQVASPAYSITSGYTYGSGSYYADIFTADVVPEFIQLSGTGNTISSGNTIRGTGTFFTTQVKAGDYVSFSQNTAQYYLVNNVISNSNLSVTTNITFTGDQVIYLHKANLLESSYSTLIFPVSSVYNTVKELREVVYRVRRVYGGTLSSGSITITPGTNENFADVNDRNFFAIIGSGASKGKIVELNNVDITTSPPSYIISMPGFTNEEVLIYATVIKSRPNGSGGVKTKTSTSLTVDFTTETAAKSAILNLGVADVYEISNVKMCSNAFGTPYYTSADEIDITSRFRLDDGQRPTFYDTSKLIRNPGSTDPTGPIRVRLKYFSHGTSGDFFTACSYVATGMYENIPKFVDKGVTYDLRDCIDYRSRINDAGTEFSGSGAVLNEFLDYESDYSANISFYLPRIDKVFLTREGNVVYKEGTSALVPTEPETPALAMPLFVINMPAYTFDVKNDPSITPVFQRRYTMKDIGKLETRIKNLEYYTSLSLLELDTALFSVKDSFGLDRFKNGFIVDAFTGHSVGDVFNPDYNIAMDFQKGELRPSVYTTNFGLRELHTSDAARTSNGYVLINNTTISLEYTEEQYITSAAASKDESVNPFNVYVFTGTLKLDPPGDVWYLETEKPIVYRNDDGTYDSLIPTSEGEKIYGSIWNSWETIWYESSVTDNVKKIDGGIVLTESNVTGESRSAVLPYMRQVNINLEATGLKPNTKMYVFLNNYDFTFSTLNKYGNTYGEGYALIDRPFGNIFSDSTGTVKAVLEYSPVTSGVKIPSGTIPIVITDSPTNSTDKESFAVAYFNCQGTLSKKNIVYTPPSYIEPSSGYDGGGGDSGGYTSSPWPPDPWPPDTPTDTGGSLADALSQVGGGAITSAQAADYFRSNGVTDADLQSYAPAVGTNHADYISYVDTGVAASTGLNNAYTTDGTFIAATNYHSSGAVQAICDAAVAANMPQDQRDFVVGVYNTVGNSFDAKLDAWASGDTSAFTSAEIAWYSAGVAAGSFGAGDVAAVRAEYQSALTIGYLAGDNAAGSATRVGG